MMRFLATGIVALSALTALATVVASDRVLARDQRPVDWRAMSLPDIRGGTIDPAMLEGRVVLVVNTASRCAFTPQYDGLEALWDRYNGRGLVVLGIPSNDFGNQEPGSNADIASFCESTFGVSFPMTEKSPVTGPSAHPVFAWAREAGGRAAVPGWNFHKILIGRDGRLAGSFPSFQSPQSAAVVSAIEEALAAPPAM